VGTSYEATAGEDDDEEAGGLDAATSSSGLRLGILGLLDDGLEPSTEGSSLDVVRHGDRTG
jgi:hypothetical protein